MVWFYNFLDFLKWKELLKSLTLKGSFYMVLLVSNAEKWRVEDILKSLFFSLRYNSIFLFNIHAELQWWCHMHCILVCLFLIDDWLVPGLHHTFCLGSNDHSWAVPSWTLFQLATRTIVLFCLSPTSLATPQFAVSSESFQLPTLECARLKP